MQTMGMATVSQSRTARSIFGTQTSWGLGASLGQSEQEWYTRAKAAVAKFDSLVERVKRIANKPVREEIAGDYGLDSPEDRDLALYRRNSVADQVREAESYQPVNYLIYRDQKARDRVAELEEWNRDFNRDVKDAENAFGILPAPVVVERIVEVPGSPAQQSWIVPVALVGAGVAIAAIFGLLD